MKDTAELPSAAVLQRELAHCVEPTLARDASAYARTAFDAGLAVTLPDGTRRPIPIGALPVVIDEADAVARADLARRLVSATAKAARWRLRGGERATTLGALTPVERRLVEACEAAPPMLAVARVDFLGASALEVNATIPAMQAYSDIAAEQWLRHFVPDTDAASALAAANGSNAAALLEALLALHAQHRDGRPERIGLLCRRGDSQVTELARLAAGFERAGLEARVVHPDQLQWRAPQLWCDGHPLPLLYRHLFLSRLQQDPSPALEAAIAERTRHGSLVLNPPAPHLEMKSTLAWLSCVVEVPALADAMGLDPDERVAIARGVPWTRRLATLEGRTLAEIEAEPDRFVLKRSWSYGGHDVFLGRARDSESFHVRAERAFPGVTGWPDLCRRAHADTLGDGFVVQHAIAAPRAVQVLCTPEAAQRVRVVTDYAVYASLGADVRWNGVCRAAADDIVNIVGGGGVVPLLRQSVAARVLEARGRPPEP